MAAISSKNLNSRKPILAIIKLVHDLIAKGQVCPTLAIPPLVFNLDNQ